jgi:hypothetical protein
LFNTDFTDQLSLRYHEDAALRNKDLAVLPLGIPNVSFQRSLINRNIGQQLQPTLQSKARKRAIDHQSGYTMGHCLSEGQLDMHIVKEMASIYGNTHDGYVQRVPMSFMWMDRFQPEVCLLLLLVSKRQMSAIRRWYWYWYTTHIHTAGITVAQWRSRSQHGRCILQRQAITCICARWVLGLGPQ